MMSVERIQSFVTYAILSASVEDGLMMAFEPGTDGYQFDTYGHGHRRWDSHLKDHVKTLVMRGFLKPHIGSGLYIPTEKGINLIERTMCPRILYLSTAACLVDERADGRGSLFHIDDVMLNFHQIATGEIFGDGRKWQIQMVSDFAQVPSMHVSLDRNIAWGVMADHGPITEKFFQGQDENDSRPSIPQVEMRRSDVRNDMVRPIDVHIDDIEALRRTMLSTRNTNILDDEIYYFLSEVEDELG